ncbi:unnamed protein product, partial [Sphacelaria rigidula]
ELQPLLRTFYDVFPSFCFTVKPELFFQICLPSYFIEECTTPPASRVKGVSRQALRSVCLHPPRPDPCLVPAFRIACSCAGQQTMQKPCSWSSHLGYLVHMSDHASKRSPQTSIQQPSGGR